MKLKITSEPIQEYSKEYQADTTTFDCLINGIDCKVYILTGWKDDDIQVFKDCHDEFENQYTEPSED